MKYIKPEIEEIKLLAAINTLGESGGFDPWDDDEPTNVDPEPTPEVIEPWDDGDY